MATTSYCQETLNEIDLTKKPAPIGYGNLEQKSINFDGETMNVNSQYLVRNGESWFPIIGEFHHNRY